MHVLSFMNDIIGAKLSSKEDKIHKKDFIGRISLCRTTLRNPNTDLSLKYDSESDIM